MSGLGLSVRLALRPGRARAAATLCAVGALLFALALGLARARGAYASELASFDDEPSHVVNGLLVRDYVLDPRPAHPLRYAERYYLHYPKVAIGQWPPAFYVLQAAWTQVFGASHAALTTLMVALTSATALLVFGCARRALGWPAALLAALLLLAVPEVLALGASVMTEVPLALACTAAALCCGAFVAHGRARLALGFALLSSAAILTKGNGLALALVPGLCCLLDRRLDALRRPALWLAGLGVALVCAPWYVLTAGGTAGTWAGGSRPSLRYAWRALLYYPQELLALCGASVALLALVGLVARLRAREGRSVFAALAALLVAVLVFHAAVPSSLEARHLVLIAPAWLVFACAGALELARLATRARPARAGPARLAACALLALAFAWEWQAPPRRDLRGFAQAARALLADGTLADSVLLVASDPRGEGAFVVDVALGEERPGHVVLRGSKTLGHSDWLGLHYEPIFADAPALAAWLRAVPVGVVLLDRSMRADAWYPHHDLLVEALAHDPQWIRVATLDVTREGVVHASALELWRQRGHEGRPRGPIDLQGMLGERRFWEPR